MPLYSDTLPLAVNARVKKRPLSLIPQSGLSLWLKADAGVTLGPAQYISSITLDSNDENGDPFPADGLYTRASGGTTTFTNSNGSYIVSIGGTTDWSIWGSDGDPEEPETIELHRIFLTGEGVNQVQTITEVLAYDSPNPVPTYSTTSTAPIPNDESLVTAWADQSGNNLNLSSITAYNYANLYPTFVSNGINSKPSISFLNSLMLSPNTNIGSNGLSIFVVGYSRGDSNSGFGGSGGDLQNYISLSNLATNSWDAWSFGAYGGYDTDFDFHAWVGVNDGTAFTPASYPNNLGTARILNLIHVSGGEEDGSLSIYSNGISQNSVSAPNPQPLNKPIGIGNRSIIDEGHLPGLREVFDGVISEIVVHDRVLTTPERQQVEAYLMEKYAICLDATSSVLMTGWVAGPRTLAPIGYAPYGLETYTYGDEVVRYDGSAWIYENTGAGEITRSYSPVARPWLATWPAGFTAEKICG